MSAIVLFLVVCSLTGAVLTAGAWVWEVAARWSGRAARWGWLAALAGTVVLPFLLRRLPATPLREAVPPVGVVRLEEVALGAEVTSGGGMGMEGIAVVAWLVLSALVVTYTVLLLVRLARARRGWRRAEVDGAAVLVSRNTGPAAVGVRRGVVVIPVWALSLQAELRRLMLLHEREHVAAGDPRVLVGALALLAVMPWHPLVWLQFVRLRNAIELDCDARVLRRAVDPARYGALLLEIGRRRGGNALVLATFAEPRAFLEQRIRRIAAWPLQRRPLRAAALGVVAVALFSSALLARVRVESVDPGPGSVPVAGGPTAELARLPLAADTPPRSPVVRPPPRPTPYSVAPSLRNNGAVMARMAERYPARLREAGVGGTASVWVLVDARGEATEVQLARSSDHAALDEAALNVAQMMEFVPAQHEGRAVEAWIEVPLTFGQLAHSVSVTEQPVAPRTARVPDAPSFTPMTHRPELINGSEVQRSLIENYPPVLRDAGIGGSAVIWFYIDETGQVRRTQLAKSSGHPALDEAAHRVARVMQFTPAKNRDRIVPVWVEIPILFGERQEAARARGADPAPVRLAELAAGRSRLPEEARERRAAATSAEQVRPQRAGTAAEAAGRLLQEQRVGTAPPTVTPMTVRPELSNPRAVQELLQHNYPPLLRDAGIGGTAWIWFFVNEEGKVTRLQLSKSSGYPALDQAAMSVASKMTFTPARNGDAVVPVWVEIPLTFTAK